jgi:hypothetical protein
MHLWGFLFYCSFGVLHKLAGKNGVVIHAACLYRLLIQLVEQYGVRKWSDVAKMLSGRIGKQCRERWHNHLRPDIKVNISSQFP